MGAVDIFMDVVDISGGGDFVNSIRWALERTTVLLAVIGPEWYRFRSEYDKKNRRVKFDYVEFEIRQVLERHRPVLPIILEDTPAPTPGSVPSSLRELAELNAVRVTREALDEDLKRLVQAVATLPHYANPISHEDIPGER
jgi:hypothetical protein